MKPGLQSAFGHTHVGQRRESNQDSYLCLRLLAGEVDGYLLAVADGMGGHVGGDIASEIAITALRDRVTRIPTRDDPSPETLSGLLAEAFQEANARIFARAQDDTSLHGMGTTMVASLTVGRRTQVANVGDSRAYLVNADGIQQSTVDHTWEAVELERGELTAEDIAQSPFHGMITRSLGPQPEIDVDTFDLELAGGDYLLLCSDGVYRELRESQMHEVVVTVGDPERCCRRLVDLANEAGAADNVTCVVGGPAGEFATRDARADTVRVAVVRPVGGSASTDR